MAQSIREVMTSDPVTLPASSSLVEAARQMKQQDIGDVLVVDGDTVRGIVTDRDIVVRAIAEGRDPNGTSLRDVCSDQVVSLSPDDTVESAVRLMRERAVRRLPVVEGGRAVGIVSIGDLAVDRDPDSALADISAARGNA